MKCIECKYHIVEDYKNYCIIDGCDLLSSKDMESDYCKDGEPKGI